MAEELKRSKPSFISSVATLLSGQAACAGLGLVTEICYARFLGPAMRGQISLCMMSIGLGVLLGGLGGDLPIVIWASDAKRHYSEWLPALLLWGVGGSLLSMGLWSFVYWGLHPKAIQGVTPHLAVLNLLTIPVGILSGYLMATLSGEERFRLKASITVADQAVGLSAFIFLMVLYGRNAESAVLGNLIGGAVGAVIVAFYLKDVLREAWRVPSFNKSVRAGLRMGLHGQFGNTATFFNYRLDVFLLSAFPNPAQVGLYALGVVVSEALWQVPQAAASALFPRTARTLDQGAAEFTCRLLRQVLLVSSVMGVLVALLSPIAIPLIFGSRFKPSIAVIWWILPGTIVFSVGKVGCADLIARYKSRHTMVFSIVGLIATVILDLLLIPRLGIRGAAIASTISYSITSILILWALRREINVSWSDLLVPTYAELARYRELWTRCRIWLWAPYGSQSRA